MESGQRLRRRKKGRVKRSVNEMSFICIIFIITLFLVFLTYDFFPVTQGSNINKLLCFYIS